MLLIKIQFGLTATKLLLLFHTQALNRHLEKRLFDCVISSLQNQESNVIEIAVLTRGGSFIAEVGFQSDIVKGSQKLHVICLFSILKHTDILEGVEEWRFFGMHLSLLREGPKSHRRQRNDESKRNEPL